MNNNCIDCGKEINLCATRCISCASKAWRKGNHSIPQNLVCIDCGKKVSNSPRCRSCAKKYSLKHPSQKIIDQQKKLKNGVYRKGHSELFENVAQREECAKLFKNGMFLRGLGDKFNCSYQTVKNILIREIGKDAYKQIADSHIAEVHRKATEAAKKVHISSWEDKFLEKHLERYYPIFKIERQYYLKGLNHAFDFAIPELNFLFEIDCDYWHKDRKARDTEIDTFAKSIGWSVLRFNDAKLKELKII